MKRTTLAWLLPAVLAVAMPVCAANPASASTVDFAPRQPATLMFGADPPAGIGGPIDLVDDRGQRFTNSNLRGRPALLFFGYTHCGVTCPVALITAKQLLGSATVMRAPTIVFITLDPLNDDVAALHRFLSGFDPRLIGLTGAPAQIEQVAERFGVGLRSNGGQIEHSSVWYLLDGHGRVRRVYAHDTPAKQVGADFNSLIHATTGSMP